MKKTKKIIQIAVVAILLFPAAVNTSFAQEGQAPAPTPVGEVQVSEEVAKQGEADLQVSSEATAELTLNLHEELGLEGYDPAVKTDGFWGQIVQPLRQVAWDAQENLIYKPFASDASYAKLVQDHANKELIAATKIYAADPTEAGSVLGMLEEYKQDIENTRATIEAIKENDPTLAKTIAAEMAGEHMFVAPKVLGSMQDSLFANAPDEVPKLLEVRKEVLGAVGQAIVTAADDRAEAVEAFKTIAAEKQLTPFSGIAQAEYLSQAKEGLSEEVASEIGSIFDEAINAQMKSVEEKLNSLQGSEDDKGESIGRYMAQMPGAGVDRLKMADQFKSQANLSPVMLEKMQDIKAKVAESIGAKIKSLVQETIREEVAKAMLDFKDTDVHGLKILAEMQDMIPDEEIRQEITRKQDEQTQKFRARFSGDANAQEVTDNFERLMRDVQSQRIIPDANFFKTLDNLKQQLNPEQQEFINNMQNTGRQELFDRMQNDKNFAQRFATFNPADVEIYKEVGQEGFGGPGFGPQFGPPPGFDFQSKFQQIEQQQAQNFGRYLQFQNRPEDIQIIQQRFQNFVPQEVRQRFETQYNFNPEAFQRQEQQAREKEEFFRQKYEQIQKEYAEKFGNQQQPGNQGFAGPAQFPGQVPSPFPGGTGFGFPGQANFGPGFYPPPFSPQQTGQQTGQQLPPGYLGPPVDSNTGCPVGQVQGPYGCQFDYKPTTSTVITCPLDYISTAFGCEPVRRAEQTFQPGQQYPGPSSGTCTQELINLLGNGCHNMNNAWFNGAMDRYVLPGSTTVKDCTSEPTSGCSGSNQPGGNYSSYPGDANSCPGFSYSRWDSSGRRYCQLNSERRCDYDYPSYLTSGPNYTAEKCPAQDSGSNISSGTCTQELINLLGNGCHNMSNAWFNGAMDRYVLPGTTAVKDCASNYTSGCSSGSGNNYNYQPPAGQKEQIWNTKGLRSWIRTDADPARIEQLKQSCANVSSGANVWMPSSGDSASNDFGMPDPAKCQRAAACTANQYFDGANCTTSGGSGACPSGQWWDGATGQCTSSSTCGYGQYWDPASQSCRSNTDTSSTNTSSSSCSAELTNLLGYSCHNMSNAWFNGAMDRYVLPGTTTVKDCSSSYISGCSSGGGSSTTGGSSCPSGQYWYVPTSGGAGYCRSNTDTSSTPTTSSSSCPAGQYWYTPPGSSNGGCVSSGYTPSDSGTACAQAGGTWNSSTSYCQMPSTSTSSGSCGSGYYWLNGACVPSSSTTSSGSCPSGSHWMSDNGGYCMSDSGGSSYPSSSSSYPASSSSYPTSSTSYPTPSTSYPTPSTSYPSPSTSEPAPAPAPAPEPAPAPAPEPAPAPTGYVPSGTVAGVFTRVYPLDFGITDFLMFFGLGVYGYMSRPKKKGKKRRNDVV